MMQPRRLLTPEAQSSTEEPLRPSVDPGVFVGPARTCVGCRAIRSQPDLVRTALVDGRLTLSRTAPGRGAWLCRETLAECVALAVRRRAFSRAFKRTIADHQIDDFTRSFESGDENVAN